MQFTSEHVALQDSVRQFVANEINPNIDEWEKAGIFPAHELFRKAGDLGFLGISKPEAYGGLDLDFSYTIAYCEAIGSIAAQGVATAINVQTDMATPALARFGSDELRKEFLAPSITGEYVACIGVSETGAGSDVASLKTRARKDGDDYLISGQKTFITNGGNANLIIVACRTGGEGSKGMSLVVVETEHAQGFRRGRLLDKIGMKAQDTAELFFDDLRVPAHNLLGAAEGQGFVQLMQQLPQERLIVALGGIAAMERALAETLAYVKERKAFGKTIWEFQNTRFKLAEVQATVLAARAMVDAAMVAHLRGELGVERAALLKYWVTEQQGKVMDECLQLFGGYGYMSEYPIAELYTDARVQRIYGGTNEIMKELAARFM